MIHPATRCFFASDLHGSPDRYDKLLDAIQRERPGIVLLGGDLLPHAGLSRLRQGLPRDFASDYLAPRISETRAALGPDFPRIFLILGNDDPRITESGFLEGETAGLWSYAHLRRFLLNDFAFYGYSMVPPTPFRLKDWERYDVSRYVDPGCISPEEGWRTVPVSARESRYRTIQEDLEKLAGDDDLSRAIFLFHTPPHGTKLDRAALDAVTVDHAPVDVHIGSIAVRRFIERRRPMLTLHGHVHESARLTGSWKDRVGDTVALSAAHDGPELALVSFTLVNPDEARRELI
jgi:Icc-related predicted phosphoesterase